MKENNTQLQEKSISKNTIEEAFVMYRETVSPPRSFLTNVLNQIPENQEPSKERSSVRSPYIWLLVTQTAMIGVLLFVVYPTYIMMTDTKIANVQFTIIDNQIASYEAKINAEDQANLLNDYNDNNL